MSFATLYSLGVDDVQDLLTLARLGAVGRLDVRTHTALHTDHGVFFDVFLDGELLQHTDVVEANDKAGTVTLLNRDADGRAYQEPETGKPATETRAGVVRFRCRLPGTEGYTA